MLVPPLHVVDWWTRGEGSPDTLGQSDLLYKKEALTLCLHSYFQACHTTALCSSLPSWSRDPFLAPYSNIVNKLAFVV